MGINLKKLNGAVNNLGKIDPVSQLNSHMRKYAGQQAAWRGYFEPIEQLSAELPVPVFAIMILIWQVREADLQKIFPLNNRDSYLDFIAWCIQCGKNEYRALYEASGLWQALNQRAQFPGLECDRHDPANAISWKILLSTRRRPDLSWDCTTQNGRAHLLYWYLLYGRNEMGFADEHLEPWQSAYLFASSPTPGLNHLQELLYRVRPDLSKVMPLPQSLAQYKEWFKRYLVSEGGLLNAMRTAPLPDASTAAEIPFGVNIHGFVYGQMGVGEDVRMAFRALQATDLPVALLNIVPGPGVSQNERSLESFVCAEARYQINLVCVPAFEHARYFIEQGCSWMRERHTIGYWPWELHAWPQEWEHLFCLVDEVWASSVHTRDAYLASAKLPVKLMPMAVALDTVGGKKRREFGLPEDDFLFLFVFDLNSSARRKNPHACLQAFLQAFPPGAGGQNAGLVIKVQKPRGRHPDWDALKKLQKQDKRIFLIEETLSRADLLALFQVCDCFLSLHRAEGFGRCIAEAMLLGMPVITTGYSGNMMFASRGNSLLVDYKMIPLVDGDYPHGQGQQWAEPLVEDAVRQMRHAYEQRQLISQLADAGRKMVAQQHSLDSVGKRYCKEMLELKN